MIDWAGLLQTVMTDAKNGTVSGIVTAVLIVVTLIAAAIVAGKIAGQAVQVAKNSSQSSNNQVNTNASGQSSSQESEISVNQAALVATQQGMLYKFLEGLPDVVLLKAAIAAYGLPRVQSVLGGDQVALSTLTPAQRMSIFKLYG